MCISVDCGKGFYTRECPLTSSTAPSWCSTRPLPGADTAPSGAQTSFQRGPGLSCEGSVLNAGVSDMRGEALGPVFPDRGATEEPEANNVLIPAQL